MSLIEQVKGFDGESDNMTSAKIEPNLEAKPDAQKRSKETANGSKPTKERKMVREHAKPRHFLARSLTQFTPMIALDELPDWIVIDGLPKYVTYQELPKWRANAMLPAIAKAYYSYKVLVHGQQQDENEEGVVESGDDDDEVNIPRTSTINVSASTFP